MSILAPPVHEPAHIEAAKQNAPAGKRNYLVGESISIVCYKMPFFHVQYNLLQINALDLVCPKINHPQTHHTHKNTKDCSYIVDTPQTIGTGGSCQKDPHLSQLGACQQ